MIRKNKSLGQWYGYKIDGVYASQHEINEQGLTEVLGQKIASIRPGDYASATRTVTVKSLLPTSYYWEVANRISQAV